MRFLLDTNFLSETAKPNPDPGVISWTRQQPRLDFAVSCLSFGEIRQGVELLPPGPKRDGLESWLMVALPRQFLGRVLPVNEEIALEWGRLSGEGQKKGRKLPAVDGYILATAAVYGLTLVTRNVRDFEGRGVPVLNPWSG